MDYIIKNLHLIIPGIIAVISFGVAKYGAKQGALHSHELSRKLDLERKTNKIITSARYTQFILVIQIKKLKQTINCLKIPKGYDIIMTVDQELFIDYESLTFIFETSSDFDLPNRLHDGEGMYRRAMQSIGEYNKFVSLLREKHGIPDHVPSSERHPIVLMPEETTNYIKHLNQSLQDSETGLKKIKENHKDFLELLVKRFPKKGFLNPITCA